MKLRSPALWEGVDYTATMTDISYLLIIFLVLCSAFAAALGLRLRLPDKGSEPLRLTPDEVVSVVLAADGSAVVDGAAAADRASAIARAVSAKPAAVVILEVAGGLTYHVVLEVLAEVKDAGAERFSLKSALRAPGSRGGEEP